MFVKSKMSIPVRYYKGSKCIVLKPNTVTLIEDSIVTAKELKIAYGRRIEILGDSNIEQMYCKPEKKATPEKKEVKLEERKEDLTDDSLKDILKQVEDELEKEDNKEVTEQVEDKKEETSNTEQVEDKKEEANFEDLIENDFFTEEADIAKIQVQNPEEEKILDEEGIIPLKQEDKKETAKKSTKGTSKRSGKGRAKKN